MLLTARHHAAPGAQTMRSSSSRLTAAFMRMRALLMASSQAPAFTYNCNAGGTRTARGRGRGRRGGARNDPSVLGHQHSHNIALLKPSTRSLRLVAGHRRGAPCMRILLRSCTVVFDAAVWRVHLERQRYACRYADTLCTQWLSMVTATASSERNIAARCN